MNGAPVTVLMAVYNGAPDLPAQLDSLLAQTHRDWQLIASDDGSQDDSRAILARYAKLAPVQVVEGPSQGFVQNFLSLIAQSDVSGPVALSDQDDVWFPEKLERALERLKAIPAEHPALYCSRRVNWWPDGGRQEVSRTYAQPPGFANALVENIAAGNTIVVNPAAVSLIRATVAVAADVPFHDWWLYLVVTGAGGTVIHDPEPGLLYRQHSRNVLGQGEGFVARLRVRRNVVVGGYAARIEKNLNALCQVAHLLTPENRARLETFTAARQAGLWRRLALMRRAGVYRQNRLAQLGFWGAVCFGRV